MRILCMSLLSLCLADPCFAAVADHFESPAVHALELSSGGGLLYAVHTADHRLVVFSLAGNAPERVAEIPVGLEPVTVRERPGSGQVWVVNHLSDSISIVDVATRRVVDTILVGDEPTDVVFAGDPQRAFVCLSQEDRLLVLDPDQPRAAGTSMPLEGSDPRSLAVSPDNSTLYVAIHESGNESTAIHFEVVDALGGPPAPDPPMAPGLPPAPRTALIVNYDGSVWRDEAGGDWSAAVGYTLLDNDVIAVDANSLVAGQVWRGVGTHLFNLAVNPVSGDVIATSQEAHNEVRFEPNLNGVFADSRVAVLGTGGQVDVANLNPHVDRQLPGDPITRQQSVSIPLDVVVSPDGNRVYVASFGSSKIAVLDGQGSTLRQIPTGAGPAALGLAGNRLYVLERFGSDLAWIDLDTDAVDRTSLGFDPTPTDVRDGRAIFYDASNSMYGDVSCATCHLFGGMDNISWDLGDPTGQMVPPPPAADPLDQIPDFHPMKGPMATQSLKGLSGTEPLHWRGDKATLADFNGAFTSLLGADAQLGPGEMALFESFVFSMRYPPNPFRELDGSLPASLNGADPVSGEQLYLTGNLVGGLDCVSCHTLPTGENGLIIPANALQEDEAKVVPQLRNLYEKTRFDDQAAANVRGFGFTHDGAVDDLSTFLEFPGFTFGSVSDQRDVEAFLLAFDTGTHPGVGAQWCANGSADPQGEARLATLMTASELGSIELVAKGKSADGLPFGWTYANDGTWVPSRAADPPVSTASLLAGAGPGTEITFTGVLVGEGVRLGIDRDEDGSLDTDEVLGGGDPGDPLVQPDGTQPTGAPGWSGNRLALQVTGPVPASSTANFLLRAPVSAGAVVDVFDLRGRRVKALHTGTVERGEMPLVWDLRDVRGRPVASGVYLVQARTDVETISRKVVVVR
jgi:YVTN family beta-propeller protein